MKLIEKWFEVTKKYELKMLVNIGGLDLPEVYLLAEYVEKLKVDGVLLLPDLFYKPKTPEDLVLYFKDIMTHMPTRPTFYYHIPMMTEVYCENNSFEFYFVCNDIQLIFWFVSYSNSGYVLLLAFDGEGGTIVCWSLLGIRFHRQSRALERKIPRIPLHHRYWFINHGIHVRRVN